MRHTLLSARREIELLRRRNEILEAKVDVMDLLAALFCASPPSSNRGATPDIVAELQHAIDKIDEESVSAPK